MRAMSVFLLLLVEITISTKLRRGSASVREMARMLMQADSIRHCNHELLPGLVEVDDVDTPVVVLRHDWTHQAKAVLSAVLDLSSEYKSDILLLGLGISELSTETY
jgi:hypothetical protein